MLRSQFEDLYSKLLDGAYQEVLQTLSGSTYDGLDDAKSLKSLCFVLTNRDEEAYELIKEIDTESLLVSGESAYYEAKMLLAPKTETSQIKDYAERAIEHSAEAILARRVLGRLSEIESDFSAALEHYEQVLIKIPSSQRTIIDKTRTLIALGRIDDAKVTLKNANPSIARELYRLSLLIRGKWRLIIFVCATVLLLHPSTGIPASILTLSLGLISLIQSLIRRDGILLTTSFQVLFPGIILTALRILFTIYLS